MPAEHSGLWLLAGYSGSLCWLLVGLVVAVLVVVGRRLALIRLSAGRSWLLVVVLELGLD